MIVCFQVLAQAELRNIGHLTVLNSIFHSTALAISKPVIMIIHIAFTNIIMTSAIQFFNQMDVGNKYNLKL